jgi:hypothetical protein
MEISIENIISLNIIKTLHKVLINMINNQTIYLKCPLKKSLVRGLNNHFKNLRLADNRMKALKKYNFMN